MLGGTKDGVKKKSAHNVLHTVPVGYAKRMATAKKKAVEVDDEEEDFVYESEDDKDCIVDVGNWGDRQGRLKSTGGEDDEDDDDKDGAEEYDENNAEVGDKEDDEAELGGNDDEDERSMNGIQELFETEAEAAGMPSRNKRKGGEKSSKQTIEKEPPKEG